jgi:hypothetical protein
MPMAVIIQVQISSITHLKSLVVVTKRSRDLTYNCKKCNDELMHTASDTSPGAVCVKQPESQKQHIIYTKKKKKGKVRCSNNNKTLHRTV